MKLTSLDLRLLLIGGLVLAVIVVARALFGA